MGKLKVENFISRTFFVVMHQKSLDKLGIVYDDWSDLDKIQKQLEEAFFNIGGIHYTSICCSAEGLYHIHDVCTLVCDTSRVKAIADKYFIDYENIAKEFGQSHIELVYGTKEEACDYIEKKGKYEEKGEKVLRIFGDRENIKDNSGQHSDWVNKLDDLCMNEDFDIDDFILDNSRTASTTRNILDRYSRLMRKRLPKTRPVTVIYVEGNTRSGKTSIATEFFDNIFPVNMEEGCDFPFDGYHGHKKILLDELRPGQFTPAELFSWLCGNKINVNVKGGQFPACWDTAVITCMFPLDDWFKGEIGKYDKLNDSYRKQFMARIKYHYKTRNIIEDGHKYAYWLPYDVYDRIPDKNLSMDMDWKYKLELKDLEGTFYMPEFPSELIEMDTPFV